MLLEDADEEVGIARLVVVGNFAVCDFDGERQVRIAETFRVAEGFGDFREGREVHGLQEFGEAFVVPGGELQEFRGAFRSLEDGAEVGIVPGAGVCVVFFHGFPFWNADFPK